jgi:hypothetical protein
MLPGSHDGSPRDTARQSSPYSPSVTS